MLVGTTDSFEQDQRQSRSFSKFYLSNQCHPDFAWRSSSSGSSNNNKYTKSDLLASLGTPREWANAFHSEEIQQILVILDDNPKNGYEIMAMLRQTTIKNKDRAVIHQNMTKYLYDLLDYMIKTGLLVAYHTRSEAEVAATAMFRMKTRGA